MAVVTPPDVVVHRAHLLLALLARLQVVVLLLLVQERAGTVAPRTGARPEAPAVQHGENHEEEPRSTAHHQQGEAPVEVREALGLCRRASVGQAITQSNTSQTFHGLQALPRRCVARDMVRSSSIAARRAA